MSVTARSYERIYVLLEILCEELGVPPTAVTKDGGEGYVLAGTIAEIARKEDA